MESTSPRIRLIHFDPAGAAAKVALLQAAGYAVDVAPMSAAVLRTLRERLPAAVVIDLDRQPSSGRDLALNLRQHKATRRVPLLIAGGEPEKVAAVRALLPDVACAPWAGVGVVLAQAIARPPAEPVVVRSLFATYAGVPLAKKLGIEPGFRVALAGTPEGLEATLSALPEGARLEHDTGGPRDLTLWFVRSRAELEAGLATMAPHAARGRLWIIWPKKASGAAGDLSQLEVRRLGVAIGLMDYKICAVDATWTGLRFTLARRG
ncbi:MAG TPA: hypothetical protein PLJ35_10755 [Anaerolineae bacterium]|nr:hypothetical protein [Anaerolineae bacterium]HPL26920.1 hypothetical protein [Anaerolineae bacterium]